MSGTSLLACEPIPWMFYAFMGPAATGGLIMGAVSALVVVVAAKALIFSLMMPSARMAAMIAMVAANVVSTIVGVIHSFIFAVPAMFLVGLGLLMVSASIAGAFILESGVATFKRLFSAAGFAIVTVLLVIGSVFLMNVAQSLAYESTLQFLAVKALALFIALLFGIMLTAGWEGLVVSWFFRGEDKRVIFLKVLKANLWTFFGIFFVGAMIAIPIRLRRANFLWPYGGPNA